jgi:hypothetical protein
MPAAVPLCGMRVSSRSPVLAAAGAVGALACLVRLPGLHAALVMDEVASARILRESSFGAMLHRTARTESTPPLWYAAAWTLHHFGTPLADVRLLSVAAGGLLAALVVWIAARFVSLPLAVVAGLFPALGGAIVVHGRQLRAYELLALLTAVLGETLLRVLARPSRRTDAALAVVVAAGGLTHYFFAFSVAAVLGWVWLDPGAAAIRRRVTVAIAVGAAAVVAWAPFALGQYGNDRFWWIGSFRWRPVLAVPLRLFTGYDAGRPFTGVLVSICFLAVLTAGSLALARRGPAGRLVGTLTFVPLVLAGLVWLAGIKVFTERNLIEIAPFVGICAVAAIAFLPRRVVPVAAVIVVGALGAAGVRHADSPATPFNRLAHALVLEGWHPTVPVVVYGNFFIFRSPLGWYLPHQPVLEPGRPLERACETVLVVARGRHAAGLRGRRVDKFTVARMHTGVPLDDVSRFHGATILGDAAHGPRCVDLVRHGRFAAID